MGSFFSASAPRLPPDLIITEESPYVREVPHGTAARIVEESRRESAAPELVAEMPEPIRRMLWDLYELNGHLKIMEDRPFVEEFHVMDRCAVAVFDSLRLPTDLFDPSVRPMVIRSRSDVAALARCSPDATIPLVIIFDRSGRRVWSSKETVKATFREDVAKALRDPRNPLTRRSREGIVSDGLRDEYQRITIEFVTTLLRTVRGPLQHPSQRLEIWLAAAFLLHTFEEREEPMTSDELVRTWNDLRLFVRQTLDSRSHSSIGRLMASPMYAIAVRLMDLVGGDDTPADRRQLEELHSLIYRDPYGNPINQGEL